MKIRMNVEDVALTMAQSSQIEQRLQAVLDGKRRRHSVGRATIVSALLLTTGAVPLLAAAQTQSDSAAQAKENKAPSQIQFLMDGQPIWRMTLTSGNVASATPKSSASASRIDIDVPSGQTMLFSAKSFRVAEGKIVLSGNVVISMRDKSHKDKTLFKADGATLVGIISPDGIPKGSPNGKMQVSVFSAKAIRVGKDNVVLTGDATFTFRDEKDASKTRFQFKAETATMDMRPQVRPQGHR